MEEYHQITITEYLTWKQEIKDRLNTTVDNFIVIGYRLKQIRDSEAYRNDGYPSMGAFVQAEYGLNEATASKFIKINDNYSEGGNSMRLQEKYQGYGYNKLYEMIALPESDRELITADTSVKEIREIKQFNKDAEQTPTADADEEKLLKLLLTDNQEAFNWIMSGQEKEHMEDILYAFAPSGSRMIRQGTMMLFLQSEQEGVKIKRFGAGQQQLSYAEFFERIRTLFTGREYEILPQPEESKESGGFDVENNTEAEETEIITGPVEKEVEEQNVINEPKNASEPVESVTEEPENVIETAENVIKEPENVIETPESVSEFPMNVPENTDPAPDTEKSNETEYPEEKTMTRYEYICNLTEFGLASYLYNHLPEELLKPTKKVRDLLAWLRETVNDKGRPYSS